MSLNDLPVVGATPDPEQPDPEDMVFGADAQAADPDPDVLAAELAERERVMALGPEPNPAMTAENLANNPSNYKPPADETPVAPVRPSLPTPQPDDGDARQRWLCVDSFGVRTGHPVFRSDAHMIDQMVHCPECNSVSVRKLAADEVLVAS